MSSCCPVASVSTALHGAETWLLLKPIEQELSVIYFSSMLPQYRIASGLNALDVVSAVMEFASPS